MMHAFKSYLMEQATGFLRRKYAQPRNQSTQNIRFFTDVNSSP
jgi:hypothetical protein